MRYVITAQNFATGAIADAFKTMAAIKAANTVGYRARLRSLSVGVADDTPADRNVGIRVNRTDNAGDGTGTAMTPAKIDPGSRASVLTAGVNYSAEPTAYETVPLFAFDCNLRGGFLKTWEAEDAPVWGPNQALGIRACPRTANAETITVTVEFEEF